jgi:hypothetical protein
MLMMPVRPWNQPVVAGLQHVRAGGAERRHRGIDDVGRVRADGGFVETELRRFAAAEVLDVDVALGRELEYRLRGRRAWSR